MIYQMTNTERRETYIGMTDLSGEAILGRNRTQPPPSITHWDFKKEEITFESIETFENQEDGIHFFMGFAESLASSNWKIIRCDRDCQPRPKHFPGTPIVPCDMDCLNHREGAGNLFAQEDP